MSEGSDPGGPDRPGGGRSKPRKQDWIGNQLRQVYDEALREAIPDDMLKLLDRLDESSEKPK